MAGEERSLHRAFVLPSPIWTLITRLCTSWRDRARALYTMWEQTTVEDKDEDENADHTSVFASLTSPDTPGGCVAFGSRRAGG
jgi:hypothetical protein